MGGGAGAAQIDPGWAEHARTVTSAYVIQALFNVLVQ